MADTLKKKSNDEEFDNEVLEERDEYINDPEAEKELEARSKDEMEKKHKELLELLMAQGKKTGNKIGRAHV